MKRFLLILILAISSTFSLNAQLPDSCKLEMGINLGGLSDYSTELPFVNLMHNAREWYTKSLGDPEYPWNSENQDKLEYDVNGYPTHAPQNISESQYPQLPATIWGIIEGWPNGKYTVLFDGDGDLSFFGTVENIVRINSNRYEFVKNEQVDGVFEMVIERSDINNHVRNIRVLMPGAEATYPEEVFNPAWLAQLQRFETVRFMDWGHTNNWGSVDRNDWDNPNLFDWEERAQVNHYTYATVKGIPYEYMIKLMNDYDLDGWVCIPHRASDNFIKNMGELFADGLNQERHLYIEYSNEIWNWIFDQTHWLNKYGCVDKGISWPEGLAPYVENALEQFSEGYDDLNRITRVAGAMAGWLDVSERIIYNVDSNVIDAVSPTFYFSFNEDGENALDQLGSDATVDDIAHYVRLNMPQSLQYVKNIYGIAQNLNKRFIFYEGGQHFTPNPFGEVPTYEQALLDIQRSPIMYNLYNEWFDSLRSINNELDPFLLMNFSFVAKLSARYGSWGLLETIDQDTSIIPAPKFKAVIENMSSCNNVTSISKEPHVSVNIYPNPVHHQLLIDGLNTSMKMSIYNIEGKLIKRVDEIMSSHLRIDTQDLKSGLYFIIFVDSKNGITIRKKIVKL